MFTEMAHLFFPAYDNAIHHLSNLDTQNIRCFFLLTQINLFLESIQPNLILSDTWIND